MGLNSEKYCLYDMSPTKQILRDPFTDTFLFPTFADAYMFTSKTADKVVLSETCITEQYSPGAFILHLLKNKNQVEDYFLS